MGSDHTPRALDHFVLPVADLLAARTRLTALGFTVAPDGVHPFGTANCCVYLADSTFLEPLAVADRKKAEAEARAGNVFTARDASYRGDVDENGFSAIVVSSNDATADHARFVAAGISAGRVLDFSRPFVDATGRQDTASFRLAFAADPEAPHIFFFAVERRRVPEVDRSALHVHANGVTAIAKVLLASDEPARRAVIPAELVAAESSAIARDTLSIAAANGSIMVMRPDALEREFGVTASDRSSLSAVGLVFRVAELARTEALLRTAAIEFAAHGARLVVPPAPGQGAAFIFEESR